MCNSHNVVSDVIGELAVADLILRRAGHVRGSGLRMSFTEKHGPALEVTDRMITFALDRINAVRKLDQASQQILLLRSETQPPDARPKHTAREVAKLMGISLSTFERKQRLAVQRYIDVTAQLEAVLTA